MTYGVKAFSVKPLAKMQSLKLAKQYSDRTLKPSAIILGDDERFWVVTLADFERCLKSGYEAA
jgi:hypothetical protein